MAGGGAARPGPMGFFDALIGGGTVSVAPPLNRGEPGWQGR